MDHRLNRRRFIASGVALAISPFAASLLATPFARSAEIPPSSGDLRGRIFKSFKFGMFNEKISMEEKFRLAKEMGYDGIELDSPGGQDKQEALAASLAVGIPIHGAVDSIHWGVRLSDPDSSVREKALKGLLMALQEVNRVGGNAVLLVPGAVRDKEKENQEQVWERSIDGIRKAIPTAARLGVRILIENVWNGFCYVHDGPENQTADHLARYLDAINSPWVGSYFDIGNHQKYGKPAEWIRTLGRRIVKLDVKDWGKKNGFCALGEGDVDWPAVRKALVEIGFAGWATAELGGGDRRYLRDVAERMDKLLGL